LTFWALNSAYRHTAGRGGPNAGGLASENQQQQQQRTPRRRAGRWRSGVSCCMSIPYVTPRTQQTSSLSRRAR